MYFSVQNSRRWSMRRNRIGGQLSGYYEYRLSDNKEKQEAIKKQKLQIRKDISQQKDILNEYREKTKKLTESKGSFRSLVRGYDNIAFRKTRNRKKNSKIRLRRFTERKEPLKKKEKSIFRKIVI